MDRSDCDKFHKKGVFTESQHYGHGFSPSVSARHELNPNWSLTIYNAASGPYSLRVMTIITVFVLPFVLAYQAWTYWVFRHRLRPGGHWIIGMNRISVIPPSSRQADPERVILVQTGAHRIKPNPCGKGTDVILNVPALHAHEPICSFNHKISVPSFSANLVQPLYLWGINIIDGIFRIIYHDFK